VQLTGIDHVAVVTDDVDRFCEFYRSTFDAEVVLDEQLPIFRHAVVRVGPRAVLHPVHVPGNPHGAALPHLLARGHLDHLGLGVADHETFEEVRERLVARGASDGVVSTLGPLLSLSFTDPDGMSGEVVLVLDPTLAGLHEPRPLADAVSGWRRG
jgi:catechol 2,3-dioxygenase-like lactoylglutathione lyase family enzyme